MSIDFPALLTAAAEELRADYASDPRRAWVDYMAKQAESHRRRLAYMAELLIPEQGRLLDIGFNLAFTHIYMTPSGGAKQVSLVNNGEPLADGSFRRETWRLRGRDVLCSYFDVDCHEAPLETGRFDVCVFLEIFDTSLAIPCEP